MRGINIQSGDQKMVYATNNADGGVFCGKPWEGPIHQIAGNSQTPTFKNRAHFWRYLREHHGVRGRIVDSWNW